MGLKSGGQRGGHRRQKLPCENDLACARREQRHQNRLDESRAGRREKSNSASYAPGLCPEPPCPNPGHRRPDPRQSSPDPKLFKLAGEAGRLRIFQAPREPAAAPLNPRPAQASSSSSAATPELAERAPRTRIELEPRAPYKKWQNSWLTEYQDENPSKRQGPKRARYDRCKVATTIGEARRLGASSQDFAKDEQTGVLSIFYWDRG